METMLVNTLVFLLGTILVSIAVLSAVSTLVLPRAARDLITNSVFKFIGILFMPLIRLARNYERRDRIMALYAPIVLLLLPIVWLMITMFGFMLMYWAVGVNPMSEAFLLSGSSLFTLGFAREETTLLRMMIFLEAAIGLGTVALLIAYLPTMYSAFSQREEAVSRLEVRAGSPPSAEEWIKRGHRNGWLDEIGDELGIWESWFAILEESHTSLSPLVFFRSPQPERSWITASGAVLDTAALMLSLVDCEFDRMKAMLCLRAGYLALTRIADVFNIEYDIDPHYPDQNVSVSREEFDVVVSSLAYDDVPMMADLDNAWRDFAGWRVNYDQQLLALAAMIRAPYAQWSSDRSVIGMDDTERLF